MDSVLVVGYLEYMRYARAVLYANNLRERSHFCIFQYLIDYFDGDLNYYGRTGQTYRIAREELQYNYKRVEKQIVNNLLLDAKNLRTVVERYLKEKNKI